MVSDGDHARRGGMGRDVELPVATRGICLELRRAAG